MKKHATKMKFFIFNLVVTTWVVASPVFASGHAMECSGLFSADVSPTPDDVQRALESLADVSAREKTLFYIDEWGFDFLHSKDYGFGDRLRDSYFSPQPLYNKRNEMDGGMAIYHGNIFVDAYYRDHRGLHQDNAPSTEQLAKQQVWFRWNPNQKTYSREYGGSQLVLMKESLKRGNGKVKLYRGLSQREVNQLKALKDGNPAVLKDIFSVQRDSIFFSTNIETAKKWSKGYYITMTVDQNMLQKSYVGIEYDYLEVAVYDPQILKEAVKTMVVKAYIAPEIEDFRRIKVDSPD